MNQLGTILKAAIIFVAAARGQLVAEERFVAWLADGKRVESASLAAWPTLEGPVRLAGQDLLSGSNPARLLMDRRQTATLKPPYVLLANGDILPGIAVALEADEGRVVAVQRMAVQPSPPLLPLRGASIGVRVDRIARIAMAPESPAIPPPPGTILLTNGRRMTARSVRFRGNGLSVLTADEVLNVPLEEIADAVLPEVDTEAAATDDNWWAGAISELAIARFHATNGAVLTASRISREQDQDRRRGRVLSAVVYCVQPAWADDVLAIPEAEVASCGYRAGNQLPLAVLPATTEMNRRMVGRVTPWIANGATSGGLVRAGDRQADTGIATHSETAIAFDLPTGAVTLEAALGFDPLVGDGGCVTCKVVGQGSGEKQTLWTAEYLRGADGVRDTGSLNIAGMRRVELLTEFAHEGRPSGADPFDIRDRVAWLAPLVRLELSGGIAQRVQAMLPGAGQWTVSGDELADARLESRWNAAATLWDGVLMLPTKSRVVLKRSVSVSRASDVVELLTACPADLDEHDFELRVNGEVVPWSNNADRNQIRQWTLRYSRTRTRESEQETNLSERLAYWWDLSRWRGKEVAIEMRLRGKKDKNEIAWRGLFVRSAVGNLSAEGELLKADSSLEDIEPLAVDGRVRPLQTGATDRDQAAKILGQDFDRGYVVPRDSRASFAVKSEYDRFVAVVGCSTQVAGPVQVLIDGQIVWERAAISSLSPGEQIDLPIPAGAKRITLQCGSDSLYYGTAVFAEAGFMTRGGR